MWSKRKSLRAQTFAPTMEAIDLELRDQNTPERGKSTRKSMTDVLADLYYNLLLVYLGEKGECLDDLERPDNNGNGEARVGISKRL